MDFTGCGNTLNMRSPRVLQLIMDSLRYWVMEMHVDGFRFDLASALARELHDVDKLGAFFDIIHQDPVLSQVKLIAEPWDLGEGGYQVGNFPDACGPSGTASIATRCGASGGATAARVSELATRLSGSSDLYEQSGRRPYASINFITAHDGFTLADLVSYNESTTRPTASTTRRREPQPELELRRRGADRRSARARAARAAAAQPDGDAAALVGRADDQRRRRAGPHAARQQQRLLPGQRDQLDSTGI